MGCLGVVIGFFMLSDAFDASKFGVRQQWECGIGLLLIFGGWITSYFLDD